MPTVTDPASELARLCETLAVATNLRGEKFLAEQFGVPRNSPEFFRVLACVNQRIDEVVSLVQAVPTLTDDYKQLAVSRVQNIKNAFGIEGLVRQWNESSGGG